MRRFVIRALGIILILAGLAVVPTLLYNLCGFADLDPDCAAGPTWMNGTVALGCVAIIFGASYVAYRLFRLTAPSKDSD
jgi:hypothetical protein